MSAAKKAKKRGVRLGTQIRGEVAEAYDKRGHGNADLVLVYSPKSEKDFVLTGELQHLHYLYCEFDPDVQSCDYSPLTANTAIAGKGFAELAHAVAKRRDGRRVWRRLISGEDSDKSALLVDLQNAVGKGPLKDVDALEVWDKERLIANPMRLRNSHRAMAWISAAREWPLGPFKKAVLDLVRSRRSATFEQIFSMGSGAERALYGAAALQLACTGLVRSDLLELPLNGMTLFQRHEA